MTRRAGLLVVVVMAAGGLLTIVVLPRYVSEDAGYKWVDLKNLGAFPLDPRRDLDTSIPAAVRELDGRKVVIVGEMYAPDQPSSRVSTLQLVGEDAMESHAPPRVQHRVFASVPPDRVVRNLTGRQVEARGTLSVAIERAADGEAVSVFRMQVDRVTEAGGPVPTSLRSDLIAASVCTAMVVLLLGGVAWVLWTARRRDLLAITPWPGRCAHCGYDLRGSVERCPECGTFFGRRDTT